MSAVRGIGGDGGGAKGPTAEAAGFLAVVLAGRGWSAAPHPLAGARVRACGPVPGRPGESRAYGAPGVAAAAIRLEGSEGTVLVFRPDGPPGACMFLRATEAVAEGDAAPDAGAPAEAGGGAAPEGAAG